jgi:hypothetical protein
MLYVTTIEAAKPREKPYKLTDGNGLHLLINPNGSKLWRLRYRFAGKQLMLSLGASPTCPFRSRDRSAMRPGGSSPKARTRPKSAAKTSFEPPPQPRTPSGQSLLNSSPSSKAKTKHPPRSINKNGFFKTSPPTSHPGPSPRFTAAEILVLLKSVEKRGHRETARRLRGAIGRVFRFAIATLRAENDPTFALRGAVTQPIVTNRAAITDEAELGKILVPLHSDFDGLDPGSK